MKSESFTVIQEGAGYVGDPEKLNILQKKPDKIFSWPRVRGQPFSQINQSAPAQGPTMLTAQLENYLTI